MDLQLENTGTNCSYNSTSCPTLYTKIVGTFLFVIVWPFIVFLDLKIFPLSRAAAALFGAVMMVVFQIVTQEGVYKIEGDKPQLQTVFLLVGMMMLSYYYDREGLLRVVMLKIFGQNKPFHTILWKVCLMSALLSGFITNDAACVVITPLLLSEFVKQGRDIREMLPLCLGIATSANIGSAATFFGNPQNAYIASQAKINLLQFLIAEFPAALIGLVINVLLLYLFLGIGSLCEKVKNRSITGEREPLITPDNIDNSLGTTMSEEREAFAQSYDRSCDPHATSQMSIEREVMFSRSKSGNLHGHFHSSQSTTSSEAHGQRPIVPSLHRFRHNSASNVGERRSPYEVRVSGSLPNGLHNSSTIAKTSLDLHGLTEITEDGNEHVEEESNENEPRTFGGKLFIIWLIVITFIMVILLAIPPSVAEFNLGCIPLAASILTMLVDTILNQKYAYDVMLKIDWTVILMFMGLFVWLEGFQNTCFPFLAFNKLAPYMNLKTIEGVLLFSVFVMVGSNLLSNVPLVILIVNRLPGLCGDEPCEGPLGGLLLAWISTIAGNFTLIGSIANLIVAEKARSSADYRVTFWGYLKFGFPSTLVIIYACLPIVYYMGKLARNV